MLLTQPWDSSLVGREGLQECGHMHKTTHTIGHLVRLAGGEWQELKWQRPLGLCISATGGKVLPEAEVGGDWVGQREGGSWEGRDKKEGFRLFIITKSHATAGISQEVPLCSLSVGPGRRLQWLCYGQGKGHRTMPWSSDGLWGIWGRGRLSQWQMLFSSFLGSGGFFPSNLFFPAVAFKCPFANWCRSVMEFSFVANWGKKGPQSEFLMRLDLFNFKHCPLF